MGCILSVPFGAEIPRSIENSSEAASNKENSTEHLRKF